MIRVGPAGWSYDDWKGIVYPSSPPRGFDRLGWISSHFDTVEVNASFYHIPATRLSRSWSSRVVNPRFRFTVKLHRSFTHESAEPARTEVVAFRRFLEPLVDDGRFGALLIQFPWSFRNQPDSLRRMERIFRDFDDLPRAVEVRHSSFEVPEFRRFLAELGVALVNVDQPRHIESIGPGSEVTAEPGYVRLHGRNLAKWFQHDEAWERYDYLYSEQELTPWVERVERMKANDVFVIMNNHFRGQAVVNALDVRQRLGQPVEVTPELAAAYPGHFEPPPGTQQTLFRS